MLTLVVDATAEHLPVLPFHRVQLAGAPPPEIGEPVSDLAEALGALSDDPRTIATITVDADGHHRYRVRTLAGAAPSVAALHEEVLDDLAPDGSLRYLADAADADAVVDRGEAVAAYLLPPTTPDRIRDAVERGERLPQKSTYFWPKPRTGMVMMPLERTGRRRGVGLVKLLDAARDHLGEAASPGTAPIEPADELPVHQHPIALGDAIERRCADRGVPRRDREGEEALARLGNGEPELGHLVTRRHPAVNRIGGDGAREHDDVDGDHKGPPSCSMATLTATSDTAAACARLARMDTPILSQVAPDVTMIDTGMADERALNAVYVFGGAEPCLVEAAPEADGAAVVAGLDALGIGPNDLAHIVVTHIHMDHAGGAGALLQKFPGATVWVHERGAPHLEDPTRLVASTARTYGAARMRDLFGGMQACEPARVRAVDRRRPHRPR